jgi:hypothetical protein
MGSDLNGEPTPGSIAKEFPEWECWQGFGSLWNARIKGATPPVMVWGEDLMDLHDQIVRKVSEIETKAYRDREMKQQDSDLSSAD